MESVAQYPSVQQLQRENAQLKRENAQLKETSAELASELFWIQEWIANPTVRDREKVGGISYYQYYKSAKPRPDGSRYYSREQVAERLGNIRTAPDKPGNKEQAFGNVHSRFKESGLITSTPEPQKSNKSLPNYFDQISPQWEHNPRGVVLEYGEKAENYGGKRVALHRECGGRCLEHTSYICTKCGVAGISQDHVLMIAEEKWQRWQEQDTQEVTPPVDEPEEVELESPVEPDIEEDEDEDEDVWPDDGLEFPQVELTSPTEITDTDKDAFYWSRRK